MIKISIPQMAYRGIENYLVDSKGTSLHDNAYKAAKYTKRGKGQSVSFELSVHDATDIADYMETAGDLLAHGQVDESARPEGRAMLRSAEAIRGLIAQHNS